MSPKAHPKAKHPAKDAGKPSGSAAVPLWRRHRAWLVFIVLLAAVLRLANFGQSPPGLNQDEAANAWNSYCLLKTGKDMSGVPWPVFYSRALGGNYTTLNFYVLLPFQAIGGMNVWTTRLPAAAGGIAAVLLVYWVGRRLFDRLTGLVAAGLLAVTPWHIQMSRWGIEANLCPFLAIAPLAMLLAANLPLDDDEKRRPRVLVAFLAGAVTGICCYGYAAIRLFLPAFLFAAVVVTWRGWWRVVRTRRGALAIGAFLVGVALTFGPLAREHLTDPEISKRGQASWIWQETDTRGEKIAKVLSRYASHFGLGFLFIDGDQYPTQKLPDSGPLHWYMLPLMLLGLIPLGKGFLKSRPARVLLMWVLAYPAGDCLNTHVSLHALRSSPGICGLVLLAAVGAVSSWRWLWKQNRSVAIPAVCAMALAVLVLNVRFLYSFFGEYNRTPKAYHAFQTDVLEASQWLRAGFKEVDAVFCTTVGLNQPFVVTLVGLAYSPQQWFEDPHVVATDEPSKFSVFPNVKTIQKPGEWDVHVRYGKMNFLYIDPAPVLKQLQESGRHPRVVFIVRPGEMPGARPVHEIVGPEGVVLQIVEQRL